ncbi:MAG TPA: hypothetical protein VMY59_04610 [Candidatus Thermoplasmatota archaeon]|nr:hypothetical protein [Candidatus Thermoplasmatota archaeon]
MVMTDKYENGLITEYELLFLPIHRELLKILEVGVFHGGGLEWLSKYFLNSEIYGVDIELHSTKFPIFKCDQNDTNGLLEIVDEIGPFDIVIDDGCHYKKETANTFNVLWLYTKMYVIEDWIAHYFEGGKYYGMLDVVTDIMRRKKELRISEMRLILKDPKCSLAYFKRAV